MLFLLAGPGINKAKLYEYQQRHNKENYTSRDYKTNGVNNSTEQPLHDNSNTDYHF